MLYHHWRCEMLALNKAAIAIAVLLLLIGLGLNLTDVRAQGDVSSCVIMAAFVAAYIYRRETGRGQGFWTVLIVFTLISFAYCQFCFPQRWDIGCGASVAVFFLTAYVRTDPENAQSE